MAVRTSTGFCAAILGPTSFDTLFRDGVIDVYTGTQPSSADLAPTGTLVGRITKDGLDARNLRFARGGRFATKDPAQNWVLEGIAEGTAGWFRLMPNTVDAGEASLDAPRIDGAIGVIGSLGDAQLFLPDLFLTPATSVVVTYWWYAMPPIGD